MATLDAPMRGVASTLLALFGTTVTLVFLDTSGYDPATASVSPSESTEAGKGAFVKYRHDEVDGERVQAGDVKVIVAAKDWTNDPTTADKLRFGSIEYDVVGVNADYSGDQIALYTMQVRAG